jgi:hypothetical protein
MPFGCKSFGYAPVSHTQECEWAPRLYPRCPFSGGSSQCSSSSSRKRAVSVFIRFVQLRIRNAKLPGRRSEAPLHTRVRNEA